MERIKKAIEKARASGASAQSISKIRAVPTPDSARHDAAGVLGSNAKVMPVDPIIMERNRIIAGNKEDPRTTAFDMLRTRILREMKMNAYRTLAVTSPTPRCGKTTVAVNLALSVAQLDTQKVLLGDLDLRRPMIGGYLGLHTDPDLSDYLEGHVPFEDALVDPEIPQLLILPNSKTYRNASEMLTAPTLRSLVDTLKSDKADVVSIFDLPPMLPTDDTMAFLPQVDCVLLVVEDGETKKQELEETLRMLEGTALVGVALNKSGASQRTYY